MLLLPIDGSERVETTSISLFFRPRRLEHCPLHSVGFLSFFKWSCEEISISNHPSDFRTITFTIVEQVEMAALASQPHLSQQSYPNQSLVEDVSEDGDDEDDGRFYDSQPQQMIYYQQQQQQNMTSGAGTSQQVNGLEEGQDAVEDEEMYSDDESSTASIPDESYIDFSLTYALYVRSRSTPDGWRDVFDLSCRHTFLATVEGQASVVKGDSLLLLDDANSYWWLVRVLKTEDVGYIPAENIETPYERLARLNKHRNVDIAAATMQERESGPTAQGQDKTERVVSGIAKGFRKGKSGKELEESAGRRVVFAPPTYVDHPGVTWSSDEDDDGESDEEAEEDEEPDEVEIGELKPGSEAVGEELHEREIASVDKSLSAAGSGGRPITEMELDDGVEWADGATRDAQEKALQQRKQSSPSVGSSDAFVAQRGELHSNVPAEAYGSPKASASASYLASTSGGGVLDPAQASNDTRRITATPVVAQGIAGSLLPSAMDHPQSGKRTASGQSVVSVASVVSTGSSARSTTPTSPPQDEGGKKMRKSRKESKDDLDGGEKKKLGVLGGLFSRHKKDKRGTTSGEARTSEDSVVSGPANASPASQGKQSDQSPTTHRASTTGDANSPGITLSPPHSVISGHGMRLAQQDQATQQAYTTKYLARSGSSSDFTSPKNADAASMISHSAAALRLSTSMNGTSPARPSSIILSPNPAGPPLLNVIRIFAGEHIRSDATFKTALVNETTSSTDLIRQAMQRFHLHHASTPGADAGYYLTVKDVNGEEMELDGVEKPLAAFQEAVQRWADDDDGKRLDDMAPTVKRSSVSSISSVISLSSHPAIAKLGMNDFSDDSTVKIYLNRRRPGSIQTIKGMPEPASEFSSYSTQLSTVQEFSPEVKSGEWSSPTTGTPPDRSVGSDGTATPPTPQQRFNSRLNVVTNGQASPERFSLPSARFTLQLLIHTPDLPDGAAFDPVSEAIVPRASLRERQAQVSSQGSRKRVFVLPRNATVVEAIEQGLERFGILEGVVNGGDDIEDRGSNRRSLVKVRYNLVAAIGAEGTLELRRSYPSLLTMGW